MTYENSAGNWNQIKGIAKAAWAELTDDDFARAEGSLDRLYTIIQGKIAESREAIEAKFDLFHRN